LQIDVESKKTRVQTRLIMIVPSEWHDRRRFPDRRVENKGPPSGSLERRMCSERRGEVSDRAFVRPPDLSNRRFLTERRIVDKGPPAALAERRISPERRGFRLEELYVDERVVLGRVDGYPDEAIPEKWMHYG
jgi:hypothetical protein